MSTTTVAPAATKTVTAKWFDLDKFEKVVQKIEVTLPNYANLQDALAAVNGDQSKLLAIINRGAQKMAEATAKHEAASAAGGVSIGAIGKILNSFRVLPRFAKLGPSENDSAEEKKRKRQEQNQALYAFIRSNPALLGEFQGMSADDDEEDAEDTE